jgi:DNA recombination protein RmuC
LTQRLAEIQIDTSNKLEQMRQTVDEKLHATLEQRLGESFKQVSDRLEQVHRGLGEMQTLATGVGDLKRVLTNVKSRGTWGEVQLGALIEQTLTIEQYSKNIATRPNSRDIVEFAIRLPGQEDCKPVWLPIDAKFPVEDYQRLTDAQDRADLQEIESAAKALETRIKAEAKTIREKYIEPPYTTDFAILFLPTEGLYAEVLRRQGLLELLQNDFRVTVAGPSTFSAMLNSLQMGFKTLSIEKRSSQIWSTLGQVKTEFSKFGEAIEATKKRLDAASKQFEAVDIRTRKINRALSNVEAVSSNSSTLLSFDLDDPDEDTKPEGSST